MKIAILGAGALGSVIGGFMARAGLDVTLLDVNEAHIEAVSSGGLKLEVGGETTIVPLAAARPGDAPPGLSLIILLTKTIHTEQALDSIAPIIAQGARVMTLQNGLGNADRVAAKVPPDHVLYGTTMIPRALPRSRSCGHPGAYLDELQTLHGNRRGVRRRC